MPALTEMEHRLAGPQAAQERLDLLEKLARLERKLRQAAARQLPPQDHQQAAALADAAQAALKVVRQWPQPGVPPDTRPDSRFTHPL